MSAKRRKELGIEPWRCKPGFLTYYDLGVEVNKVLPKFKTLKECGRELGITKQNAYTESVLALGKLCFALRAIRKAHLEEMKR